MLERRMQILPFSYTWVASQWLALASQEGGLSVSLHAPRAWVGFLWLLLVFSPLPSKYGSAPPGGGCRK